MAEDAAGTALAPLPLGSGAAGDRHGALPFPPPQPWSPNHLAELARQRAHAILTGRLAAIVQAHALLRLPFDGRDPVLRRTLQGITRLPPRRAGRDPGR